MPWDHLLCFYCTNKPKMMRSNLAFEHTIIGFRHTIAMQLGTANSSLYHETSQGRIVLIRKNESGHLKSCLLSSLTTVIIPIKISIFIIYIFRKETNEIIPEKVIHICHVVSVWFTERLADDCIRSPTSTLLIYHVTS